ncbi:MAG: DUF2283 domain-containing protein [bacterium]|nr:DUF2283 domain-containing protein [bacterium]
MKVQYDKAHDTMYINLAAGSYDKSKKISESIMVDMGKNGTILGIEILDATENIKHFDPKNPTVNIEFLQ